MAKIIEIKQLKYLLAGAMVLSLALTLVLNYTSSGNNLLPKIRQALPEANNYSKVSEAPIIYAGFADSEKTTKVGYIAIGESRGYGGPLTVAVGLNMKGEIISAVIVGHKDTPGYIQMILNHGFMTQFIGKNAGDPLTMDRDIDRVSGATYSSMGIARAIAQASHAFASDYLGLPVQEERQPLTIGLKEISILVLLSLMVVGSTFKISRLRWVTLIGGLVFLGFMFNAVPSIGIIASIFMGYFPPIEEYVYWYLLFLGIPLITIIFGKNLYCFWVCPFGAVQEIMSKLGSGKYQFDKKVERRLKKVKYVLLYFALMLAFLYNSPSLAGYEPFAAFFGQKGYLVQWLILAITLLASLFIKRFWCNFFCPVGFANELIARLGRRIMGLRKGKKSGGAN